MVHCYFLAITERCEYERIATYDMDMAQVLHEIAKATDTLKGLYAAKRCDRHNHTIRAEIERWEHLVTFQEYRAFALANEGYPGLDPEFDPRIPF